MAIRKRPGRASPYQVYWNNPITGKRESASFSSLQDAKKHDSLVKHRLQFERESFRPAEDEDAGGPEGITVETLCYLYIKSKRLTKANAAKMLSALDPVFEDLGSCDIKALNKKDIMAAMQKQLDAYVRPPKRKKDSKRPPLPQRRIKPITVKNRFGILKSALNWAEDQDWIDSTPKFPTRKPPSLKIPPPTISECADIYAAAAPHVRRAIVLGLSFGMRIGPSELLKITWDDIDLKLKTIRIWSAGKNKNMPWRNVPLPDALVATLEVWQSEDNSLGMRYLIHYRRKPITSGFGKAWRATLRRAGITRRIRPYDLRHAFATEALVGNADIGAVAAIMGHADPTMILTTYQHVKPIQKKQAVESIPKLPSCAQMDVPKQKRG